MTFLPLAVEEAPAEDAALFKFLGKQDGTVVEERAFFEEREELSFMISRFFSMLEEMEACFCFL